MWPDGAGHLEFGRWPNIAEFDTFVNIQATKRSWDRLGPEPALSHVYIALGSAVAWPI